MVAEVDVEREEGEREHDAERREHAQRHVDGQVDPLQPPLLQRPVPRWVPTCSDTAEPQCVLILEKL